MEIQNPFSFYDFLGYMLPGMFLLLGIDFIRFYPMHDLFLPSIRFTNYVVIIVFIILCYLVGHIVSFISSITIEKYSIWTLGYPSKYLFSKKPIGYYKSTIEKFNKEELKTKGSYARLFARLGIKSIIGFALIPIFWIDFISRSVLRLHDQYARPLDKDVLATVQDELNSFLKEKFNVTTAEERNDYFRIIYHYSLEHSKNHVPKMQNYVALYGFSRANTFNFVIFFWYSLYRIIQFRTFSIYYIHLFLISGVSFLLYLAFNKFLRKFTLEAIMAFIALRMNNERPDIHNK